MPPRVLHVVETLGRGATENWLLRMLAHAKAVGTPVDWTFYCALGTAGPQAAHAVRLGAKVVASPVPIGAKSAFFRALRAELKSGNYDVLHSHHDLVSGIYLAASAGVPLRQRIVHVHNAGEAVPSASPMKRQIFRPVLRRACLTLADRIVGVSNHTLDTFLAGRQRRPARDLVSYSGVRSTPFAGMSPDRGQFRRTLGLEQDALIMLFAGRMVAEKNPAFVIEVLLHLRKSEPRAVAVFAGAGPEEEEVLRRAKEAALADHVRVLGWRDDVAAILRCADWFILPSPEQTMEGFGLAVVEAQLAGLRLLLSNGIPDDPLLPGAAYRRMPLSDGPEAWATAAAELMNGPSPSASGALDALASSPMDMDRALAGLLALHS